MTMNRLLWLGAALVCIAIGFVVAQQYERNRSETRIGALREQQNQELTRVRGAADDRIEALARKQGEIVLQAFAAGISPAVLAGRRDSVEIAAVGMLHVPGIAGVHVLAPDGSVIYSSDAKLTATGEGQYRGSWALGATELMIRASSRPEVLDIAVPIVSAGEPKAVTWLEYDVGAVKTAAAGAVDEQGSVSEPAADATRVSSRELPSEPK